jgi:malonyl-CoA O-methyltransferase
MSISFSKQGIARGFSEAAAHYERWAAPQRTIAEALAALLPDALPPGPILDLGCGTGLLTGLLIERYPGRKVVGVDVAPAMVDACRAKWPDTERAEFVVDDAEQFASGGPWALVASSCSFQWFEHPAEVLRRFGGQLAPGGFVALAVPVQGSLPELNDCYGVVLKRTMPGLTFLPPTTYEEALAGAGLLTRCAKAEPVVTMYDHGLDALRSFKGVGATFQHQHEYTALNGKAVRALVKEYDRLFAQSDGRVPLTYQALYCVAESTT